MRIERHPRKRITIVQFADKHGLVMEVHERTEPTHEGTRYYAHFKHASVVDGHFRLGAYGDGANEDEAIDAYARAISGRLLTVDGVRIDVPLLEPRA